MTILMISALAAGGAAAGAILGPVLAQVVSIFEDALRKFWGWVFGLFFTTYVVADKDFRWSLNAMLMRNRKGPRRRWLTMHWKWIRSLDKQRWIVVAEAFHSDTLLYWYGGRPLAIYSKEEVHYLVALRGTLDLQKLCRDVEDFVEETKDQRVYRRFRVFHHSGSSGASSQPTDRVVGTPSVPEGSASTPGSYFQGTDMPVCWPREEVGEPPKGTELEDLSLTPMMQRGLRDVRFWHSHREWYRERGLAWRRGYLLYGPPGTGKTSFVRAVGQELDMPIHRFDLSSMSNQEFRSAWELAKRDGSRIVLLEDFDTVFHGRDNIHGNQRGGLTFDEILNAIDGVEREDGLLLYVTTNHVEHIDPALGVPDASDRSTRPGRIDVTLPFLEFGREARMKLALRLLVGDHETAARLADEGDGDSAVQFQERCLQEARRQLQEEWEAVA